MSQLKEIREKIIVDLKEVVEQNTEKIKDAYKIIMKLEHVARKEGILALEYEMEFLEKETPLCDQLAEMIELVVGGTEPSIIEELLTIRFFAEYDYKGIDGLLYFLYGRSMLMIQEGFSARMIEDLFNAVLPGEILNFKQQRLKQDELKRQQLLEWKRNLTEEEKQILSDISTILKDLSEEEWKIIAGSKGLYGMDKVVPYLEEAARILAKKYMNNYRYYVIMTEPGSIEKEQILELQGELKKTIGELRNQEEEEEILDHILKYSDEEIQLLLRNVDILTLATALKDVKEEVADCFYRNLSVRLKYMIQEDMEYMGIVRKSEIREAQKKIMEMSKDVLGES